MDFVYRLQALRLTEGSDEIVDDVDRNHLPPSLKLDWTRTRNKLKQNLNEALAEIELAKKCEIQLVVELYVMGVCLKRCQDISSYAISTDLIFSGIMFELQWVLFIS